MWFLQRCFCLPAVQLGARRDMNKGLSVWENSWHSYGEGGWELCWFRVRFLGGDCSVGWKLIVSMQQLEMAGWHSIPRTESWLGCGCAALCCLLENRRKERHLALLEGRAMLDITMLPFTAL